MKRFIIYYLTILLAAGTVVANDSVRVSLVTFYPGSEIFELYGHTELRVTQGAGDYYFNYGVFNFDAPGFTARFVAGATDYLCAALPAQYATVGMEGRKMVEQDLNLTQEQAAALRDALILNIQPANSTYRYRYFSDNCSTRPRDMIERAVGAIDYPVTQADTTAVTLHQIISHYNRNYAWEQLGIDLALGTAIDRPITGRDAMFVPMLLMQAMSGATIQRGDSLVPLVARTRIVVDGSYDGTVLPPTPWLLSPFAVFSALFVLLLVVAWWSHKRHRQCNLLDAGILLTAGIVGCLLAFLVLVSTHEATSPNWNLLWLHPGYLVGAAAVLSTARWARVTHRVLLGLLLLAAVCWPFTGQHFNIAFVPIMLMLAVTTFKHCNLIPLKGI